MARFKTSGLDDMISAVGKLGEDAEEITEKMLQAGAEEVKQAWKASAEKHKVRDTGDMIDSIGFARKPKKVGDIKTIDIYPQGKNRRGVRNAEVAFVRHYGTSEHPGTHFVDDADADSGPKVQAAMENVYDEELVRKGLK